MLERFRERSYSPSRRKVLAGTGLALGIGIDHFVLKDGLKLREPDLTPRPKRINLRPREAPSQQGVVIDIESGVKLLRLNDRTYAYYNTDGELIFQHIDAAFEAERKYMVSHRSGNQRKTVEKAIELGADGFDIDTSALDNVVVGHGIAGELSVGPLKLGGSIDPTELSLKTRIPRTVADMLYFISSKSDQTNPYIVQMELKRRSYSDKSKLYDVAGAISACGLPVRVFSPKEHAVDNLYTACEELSQGIRIF